MPSKKSFFNTALFRKNLTRYWPLWGGVTAVGCLVPLYILLALLNNPNTDIDHLDFANSLYMADTIFVPAATACYAILCAMAVWGYLFNSRSVGLLHTLPVDRTCLFVTNTLSGLAMVLLPYAVVGAFSCLIALFWGFFDLAAVGNTILTVLFLALLFFGLATLCAMLTGHGVVLPVFYLLLNFLAPMLEVLLQSLAEAFLLGVGFSDFGRTILLSPLFGIYTRFSCNQSLYHLEGIVQLNGMGTVALYGLVGVGLLALGWLLYRLRQSECAGDVVSFPWLRPVFRWGLALLSALTLGRLLYELLWVMAFFRDGQYAALVPMCICMAATAALGYYIASMLLEKSLRVFQRKSLPGVAAVCAAAVLLCVIIRADLLGSERWTPDAQDVVSVDYGDYSIRMSFTAEDNPEEVRQILDIHQAIIADRDYIRAGLSGNYQAGKVASRFVRLYYHLANGRSVQRMYDLWVTADRTKKPETFDAKLLALYNDPETIRKRVALPEGAELSGIYISNYYGDFSVEQKEQDFEANRVIYDAILQDLQDGNVPGYDLLNEEEDYISGLHVELEYRLWDSDTANFTYRYQTIPIFSVMTHTIQQLDEMGYLSPEQIKNIK